jgi:hypothetical protein
MNSFVETLSPAARNHAEARIDYYTDLTQAVLVTLRQLTEANVQFSRSWLDDSTAALRNALLTPPGERAAEQAAAVRRRAPARQPRSCRPTSSNWPRWQPTSRLASVN